MTRKGFFGSLLGLVLAPLGLRQADRKLTVGPKWRDPEHILCPEAGAWHRRIYRSSNGGAYHLVHTIADNTTATVRWCDGGRVLPERGDVAYNIGSAEGVT